MVKTRFVPYAIIVVAALAGTSLSYAAGRKAAPKADGPKVGPARIIGSCTIENYGIKSCSDYEGPYKNAPLKETCTQYKGTWSADPCPTAGRVGTCTKSEDVPEDLNHTRMYAPYTAESAKKVCEQNLKGTFTAG